MSEQLWSKFDVADRFDLSVKGADNWLRRHRDRVPIAGRSEPVRGGSTNLYRAADVLAARGESPGRGNRTPRRAGGLKPEHREILETLAVNIEKYGHENSYVHPVKTPSRPSEYSTYTITAMQRRGLVARETLTSFLSMGGRNGVERMTVAYMTATGRRALDIDDYPEIPEDGPGDERVIMVQAALEDAKRDGVLPADTVIAINCHGFASMVNVYVEIEGGRHLPRKSAAPLASKVHDLVEHCSPKVKVWLNSQDVDRIRPT